MESLENLLPSSSNPFKLLILLFNVSKRFLLLSNVLPFSLGTFTSYLFSLFLNTSKVFKTPFQVVLSNLFVSLFKIHSFPSWSKIISFSLKVKTSFLLALSFV